MNLFCEERRIFTQGLYSMIDANYSEPITLNVVTEHNSATAIIQLRPTQQPEFGQNWGIRDFSILYYPCPAGCEICSSIDTVASCSQWVASYSQFASLSISEMTNEGWFINDDSEYFKFNSCNGIPYFGSYNYGMILKRKFFLEQHFRVKIQFLFVKLNNWGTQVLYLRIDNVIQKQITDKDDLYHNVNYCDSNSGLDSIQRITIDISHYAQMIEIQIDTTLSQFSLDNSFGIRDFTIFILACDSCPNVIQFSPFPIQYFTELYFGDSQGWIIEDLIDDSKLYNCSGQTLYGRFTTGGHITRQFNLTPHRKVKISVVFYLIDSWDFEMLYILIDGVQVDFASKGPVEGMDLCGDASVYHEKLHTFNYEADHISNTITIYVYSNLNEGLDNESFGMRDFRLQLADCPFDCIQCNTISGDYCQYQYRDEYWNLKNAIFLWGEGWGQIEYKATTPQATSCNGKSIFGGYGSVTNQSFLKLTQVLDSHNRIRLLFKLYVIGDWANDEIIVTINNLSFYSKTMTTTYSNFNCQANLQAIIIYFDKVLDHTDNILIIKITNTIDLFPKDNKSFGIRDVFIYYQAI